MNSRVLIAFGTVAVAVVVLGAAFVLTQKSPSTSEENATVATETQISDQSSLKNLLTSGQSQTCTFKDLVDDADYDGTVYVSKGRMRGDFANTSNGETFISHMIVNDNKNYTWIDGQPTGFMMEFDINKTMEQAESENKDTPKTVDINKTIDYKCSGWTVDESKFNPPADIEFQDFSKMLAPSGSQGGTQDQQSQCSVCDNLTGDEKTQCRTALDCN